MCAPSYTEFEEDSYYKSMNFNTVLYAIRLGVHTMKSCFNKLIKLHHE